MEIILSILNLTLVNFSFEKILKLARQVRVRVMIASLAMVDLP